MNLIAHSIASKGSFAFVRRVGSVALRFQLGSSKAERSLGDYLSTLRRHGCNATFPITAVVLQRHRDLARWLYEEGVELAVHGYVHVDHTTLSERAQREQIARALDVFSAAGIPADGFRGPYLRSNQATLAAAESLGFRYVSNETISYDVFEEASFRPTRWREYQKALELYSALPAQQAVARPRMRGSLVEIPVSMPDDEILVDRLGFRDGATMGEIWTRLLDWTYATGDLLTLQLHPERASIFRDGLSIVLGAARKKSPTVWIAQLRDIAEWWRRRARFRLDVAPNGEGRWTVSAAADPDAMVLLMNAASPGARDGYGSYATLNGLSGEVEAAVCPVVGIASRSHELKEFLLEEGYAVRETTSPTDCSIYLDRPGPLTPGEQVALLSSLETSARPLVRLARWPDGARSALAITGDVDAITVGDFVLRPWEVL